MRLSRMVLMVLSGVSLAMSQGSGGGGGSGGGLRLEANPTRQGPVLFPNDAPSAPRPPLVVTSRPLAESIARSELAAAVRVQPRGGSEGDNNTLAASSHISGRSLAFEPHLALARIQQYREHPPAPPFAVGGLTSWEGDGLYEYEDQSALPPIYKVISDHTQAQLGVRDNARLPDKYKYKAALPRSSLRHHNNNIDEDNSEYDQNQNYAFSYTVKDEETGDDFSHSQKHTDSGTNGEYRVRLPDGRTQVVSYTADRRGYRADVRFDTADSVHSQGTARRYGNDDDYNRNNDYTGRDSDYVDRNNHYVGRNNDYVGKNNGYATKSNDYTYVHNDNHVYDVASSAYQPNRDYVNTNNVFVKDDVVETDRSGEFYTKKQVTPVTERDDYYYPDVSKESYNDYSTEYNSNHEPHTSKYTSFNVDNVQGTGSTVKPTYEELKHLFVDERVYRTRPDYDPVPKGPPSTSLPHAAALLAAKSPNLYTSVQSSLPAAPTYASPKVVVASTPGNYLVSTIASLNNKLHLASKPILSDRFIERINKYLSFN